MSIHYSKRKEDFATMEKNITKKLIAGALALSAGCLLASCDPISSVPSNYNEPIVEIASGAKFDENILGTLYDSIASDKNSKVLDKMLKEIVEKQFGTYAQFKDGTFTEGEFFKGKTEEQINMFKKDVNERISEFFYNEITSGSYNDDEGQFSEEKLFKAHRQELYELEGEAPENKFYVTKSFEKKDAFASLVGDYTDYIEKKVFPEILKDKLVENYVYEENPLALGRSYAREISFVKVPYTAEFHSSIRTLLKNYAKDYIEKGAELNFEDLVDAIKGFSSFDANGVDVIAETGSVADALLNSVYGKEYVVVPKDGYVYEATSQLLIPEGKYYKHTKIGELIESFQKAIKAEEAGRFPTSEDKAELDKFVSEGKTKEYGLLQKLISLSKEDYTTKGWFVKNGGANELPSSLRDRLFSIKVANEIEGLEPEATPGAYEKKAYLRNIQGTKFVLSSEADKFENDPYNYIFDDNSSSLWLCSVTEAVSPSKFNERLDAWYGHEEGRVETIGRAVAKVLGTKDNYIKETYTKYLNEYKDVLFYDTALYDYFKAEYPDLDIFDED